MSVENPIDKDAGRMGLEEAHTDANMLRVKMEEMEEVVGHEPTAQDYDNARGALEAMKEAAENESDFDKAFLKILQAGNKYFTWFFPLTFGRFITLGKMTEDEWIQKRRHMFDDAQARLDQLKNESERMEWIEKQRMKKEAGGTEQSGPGQILED